jgi:hypothetical protein
MDHTYVPVPVPGTNLFLTLQDPTPADIASLTQAVNYLSLSPAAMEVIQGIAAKGVPISINHGQDDQYDFDEPAEWDPSIYTIHWDPGAALAVSFPGSNGPTVGVESAALMFVHEAAHALDPNLFADLNTKIPFYDNLAEFFAVGKEDAAAVDLGEHQRFNHGGDWTTTANPTEHTDGTNNWVQLNPNGGLTAEGTYQPGTFPENAPQGGGSGFGAITIEVPKLG